MTHAKSPTIAVKVPADVDGLKACKSAVSEEHGQRDAVFFCQPALLAAGGRRDIHLTFIGRLDDISLDGLELIGTSA
jgi:transaldolase